MDYYYALLDNYKLLRQRKFKLSLREEEDEGGGEPTYDEAEAKTAILAAAGTATSQEEAEDYKDTKVKVWKTEKEDADKKVTVSYIGYGPQYQAALMVDGVINPEKKPGADKIIAMLLGGKGEGSDTDTTEDDTTEDDINRAKEEAIAKLGKEVEEKLSKLIQAGDAFPGLKQETKHTRRPESLINLARGDTQGFTGSMEDLEEKLLNSDKISLEEKEEALKSLLEVINKLGSLRANSERIQEAGLLEQEARELGDLLDKIKITRSGVLIDGVGFFYRQNSTPETDALRNMVEQLNDAAKLYNSEGLGSVDVEPSPKISEAKEVDPPTKSGGANESYRGPVAEKFMKISGAFLRGKRDYEAAKTPQERQKIMARMKEEYAEVYADAMDDGSYEKMMEVFSIGRSVALGEMLAKGRKQISDADFVIECRRVLVDEMGMGEEAAEEMIRDAAGAGQLDRQLMMTLLLTSMVNQNMDRELFGDNPDLIPDNIEHAGDTDATSSGKKADLIFEWDDDEKCEQIQKYYEKKLGNTKKKGCGGEGSGLDNLVKPKEGGGCRMEVELKTLTSSNSKGGAGELSTSRTQSICNDAPVIEGETTNPKTDKTMSTYEYNILTQGADPAEGMTQATKDFADRNNKRLDDCVGEGTSSRACAQQKKLDAATADYDRLLTPWAKGVTPAMTKQTLDVIEEWWKNKSSKMQERYEAAKRAANGTSTDETRADDKKQLNKLKKDIQQMALKDQLPTGKMTDPDWIAYMCMNYSQACGSTEETLRVSRGLEDGYQSVYLNNATVESNLEKVERGDAWFHYEEGSGTIRLIDKETGETLASVDTARGISKWTIGQKSGSRNVISEKPPAKKKKATSQNSEIFVKYLEGQKKLLEALLNRAK